MKNLIFILVLALLSQVNYGQSIFDKYESQRDVSSMIVTPSMFKLMSKIDLSANDPDAKRYMNMVENLENIRIFTTPNATTAADMRKSVESYISASSALTELMRVNDGGKIIRFYVKEGKNENFVSELLMFLEDPNSKDKQGVIMSITGNIDLRQISRLTSELNVPGSEQLKNIEKKN